MISKFLFIGMCFAFFSCANVKKNVYQQKKDDDSLMGIIKEQDLRQDPYKKWFDENYKKYKTNTDELSQIKDYLEGVEIKAFIGTWCSDSQRDVPAFYKILREADFDFENLQIVALDKDKKTPDNLQKGFDIAKVPTYIFYKKGKEIGRYVEYPIENIEKDLLKILSGKPYQHN